MGETTKINWSDSTCNFWSGCTKVSPGCANCYAETLAGRFDTLGKWGKGKPRQLHENAFKLAAKLNRKPWVCDKCGWSTGEKLEPDEKFRHREGDTERLCTGPFHRRRIFSLSLGDWLDPEVPVEWLARMLDTVRQCPDVDWLLCTKRPELFKERMMQVAKCPGLDGAHKGAWMALAWGSGGTIPENIVLLASVENQEQADKRIPELLRIPAWRRGLSCEPLLGPVDLHFNILQSAARGSSMIKPTGIDWVIVGGESGDKARPCNVDWIRSLRDQCEAAAVPCFVKQLGAFSIQEQGSQRRRNLWNDRKGGDWNEWPEDLKVREFYRP